MRLAIGIIFATLIVQGFVPGFAQDDEEVQTPARNRSLERYEFNQIQMGMPFRIIVYAPHEDSANAAVYAAYARIRDLNKVMSDYDPDSELMKVCRSAGSGDPVPISQDLQSVLSHALVLSKKSDGAFDISVGPVVKLWRKARKSKTLPNPAELASALELVGYQNIRLNEKEHTVELLKPGMQLDLGGIGVGFAIDEALAVLKNKGIESALIDGSGDIGVSGPPPGEAGWRIGIAPLEADREPSRFLILKNGAVTTSGDAYQFVEVGGKRYSHIVDPKTGLGLTERNSVTVIAPNCTVADSYTKVVCVLGAQRGFELLEETPQAAAIIVRLVGERVEALESKRIAEYSFDER